MTGAQVAGVLQVNFILYRATPTMSALGQKPTCAAQKGMSALHPKAPRKRLLSKTHVRFAPKSGHVRCTSSFLLWAINGHPRSSLKVGKGAYLLEKNRHA